MFVTAGKILDDSSVIGDHGIDEKKFIVIMVTKPKVTEPVNQGPANPTAQQASAPAPTPAAAPAPASTPAPAPAAEPAKEQSPRT